MFRKVLIANRGEIALRILRACRDARRRGGRRLQRGRPRLARRPARRRGDLHRPGRRAAVVPARRRRSSRPPSSPAATRSTRATASCPRTRASPRSSRAHDLTFIGPPAERPRAVRQQGRHPPAARRPRPADDPGLGRHAARRRCTPSSEAERIGYPVLIKPSAGGGGKGMRMVRTPRELESVAARSAAPRRKAAFGDDSLYLEKWLDENRHVEVQVAVDRYGHGVHLGERDCSVQRRHQKILEEAPDAGPRRDAPGPTSPSGRSGPSSRPATRTSARSSSSSTATGNVYFIEINCRIQVEHPVTEMLTGIDLVATQIRIAAGEPLGLQPGRRRVPRPRHRVPHQRRGPRARLPARRRRRRALPRAGRPGRPHGLAPVHRLRGPAVLRLAARQAHRLGPGPRDRPSPAAGSRSTSWSSRASSPTSPSTRRCSATETFLEGQMTTNLLDRVGSAAFLAAAAPRVTPDVQTCTRPCRVGRPSDRHTDRRTRPGVARDRAPSIHTTARDRGA